MPVDVSSFYAPGLGLPSAATMGGFNLNGALGVGSATPVSTATVASPTNASPANNMMILVWSGILLGAALLLLHVGGR